MQFANPTPTSPTPNTQMLRPTRVTSTTESQPTNLPSSEPV
jgi:hypothetical protein